MNAKQTSGLVRCSTVRGLGVRLFIFFCMSVFRNEPTEDRKAWLEGTAKGTLTKALVEAGTVQSGCSRAFQLSSARAGGGFHSSPSSLQQQSWFRIPLTWGWLQFSSPTRIPVLDSPVAHPDVSCGLDKAPVIRVANVKQPLLLSHQIVLGCFHQPMWKIYVGV